MYAGNLITRLDAFKHSYIPKISLMQSFVQYLNYAIHTLFRIQFAIGFPYNTVHNFGRVLPIHQDIKVYCE